MDMEKLKKMQQSVRIGKCSLFWSIWKLLGALVSQCSSTIQMSNLLTLNRSQGMYKLLLRTILETWPHNIYEIENWRGFNYSGKGTPRRKQKTKPKNSGVDDKKLQTALKKLNVQPIQAIEEVNMFKSDGNVIHFAAPKGMQLSNNSLFSQPHYKNIMWQWISND